MEKKEYAALYAKFMSEIEKEKKTNKNALFPRRMIGDQDDEQFARLQEFGEKYNHENCLSEYITPKTYETGLIKWRQKMHAAAMKPFATTAKTKADKYANQEEQAAMKEKRDFNEVRAGVRAEVEGIG